MSGRRTNWFAWGLLVLCGASACVRGERRGRPLYAGEVRSVQHVAQLRGPITKVDGYEISEGSAFELEPGCHIVQIGGRVGAVDPSQSGYSATLPALTYAFRMRPGATYTIEFVRRPSLGQGPMGWGNVVALELDAQSRRTEVPLVRSRAQIADCLSWQPEAVGPS